MVYNCAVLHDPYGASGYRSGSMKAFMRSSCAKCRDHARRTSQCWDEIYIPYHRSAQHDLCRARGYIQSA